MHAASVREFNLVQNVLDATKRSTRTDLVMPEAMLKRRAPLRDLARVENLKRARLYHHDREAYEVRVALLGEVARRPLHEECTPDVAKRRKYKGKPIARTLRY